MRPAIGTPIRVRQSENAKELIASPTRFITRTMTAVQKPHGRRRHKPVAAAAHARQTVPIRTTPNLPNGSNPSRARGFRPQRTSMGVPGTSRISAVSPEARTPKRKKNERTDIPTGRRCCSFMSRWIFLPLLSEVVVTVSVLRSAARHALPIGAISLADLRTHLLFCPQFQGPF